MQLANLARSSSRARLNVHQCKRFPPVFRDRRNVKCVLFSRTCVCVCGKSTCEYVSVFIYNPAHMLIEFSLALSLTSQLSLSSQPLTNRYHRTWKSKHAGTASTTRTLQTRSRDRGVHSEAANTSTHIHWPRMYYKYVCVSVFAPTFRFELASFV